MCVVGLCVCVLELCMDVYARAVNACVELWLRVVCVRGWAVRGCARALYGCVC